MPGPAYAPPPRRGTLTSYDRLTMNRFRSFAALATLGLTLLAAAAPASAQDYTFKLHTLVPPVSSPVQKFLKPWGEKVEKASNGRIKVEVYPSMQLGGRPEQLPDQVRDGIVDIVWTVPGYTPGRFVQTEVFELPFVHTTTHATNLALQDFAERHGEEYREFKVLLLHVHAGAVFHTIKPVHTVSAFQGRKLRTPSRVGGWFLESLGAVPVGAPVSQIPEMLSKKVVDGVIIPFEIAWALKTHEMVDHHTLLDDPQYPRPVTSVFLFAMNKGTYASLPGDLKKVIDDHSGRAIAGWAADVWDEIEEPGENAAKASGEVFKLPRGEVAKLRAAAEKPVHDRWIEEIKARNLDGRKLIAEARDLIAKYSK
jgi:TRAP-type C4-dicarboxylate transport system substrate-binding protein